MEEILEKVKIIGETDDYVVIDKPTGLMVHPDGKNNVVTLVDWILEKYPEVDGIGEPITTKDGVEINRPGIVHRLDRDTSGVMVIAKTRRMFKNLKTQFRNRRVRKTYLTFVYGRLKDERGLISRSIGRSKSDFRKWTASGGVRGEVREAATQYKVSAEYSDGPNKVSLLEAWPKTGRTHQIRVHMKAIGHCIVADSLYAEKQKPLLGFERLALHSYRLIFFSLDGEKKTFEAEYPEDFNKAIELGSK